jgi:DHA1 family multidrug resistance protein-like MFS transporter
MFADLFGYRASFFVAAALLFASFLTSLFFVREQHVKPESDVKFSLFADFKALIVAGGILPIVAIFFLYSIALTIQRPQIPLLVRDIALTDTNLATQAGFVIAAAGIASVLAGIIIGALTDRGKTVFLGVACSLIGSLFVGGMIFAAWIWQLALLNFLFAFTAGGLDPILKTILTHIVPMEKRGSAFGLLGSANAFGWFVGALSGGILASMLGLRSVFLTSTALFVIVAALLALLAKRK